jgi:KaiC/GvpD/RAD55 family RecA-like ATPase
MLELAAGTYAVPHAGLNYVLASDLRLPAGSRLRLRGENGAGKTTFLEHVLIPALRRRHRILYLSQDTELQRNTIRATLALMGRTAPRGLADMVAAWIEAADCRDVIILDEFDKYLNDAQVQTLGLHRFSWAVQVSHLERAGERHEFAHEFNLHFRREGAGKPGVFLEAEQLWPA